MILKARQFEFAFPRPALVMGILNVTPDSFSDGGCFFNTPSAVAHGAALVEQGADILDIGGESTRPNSVPVEEAEELRRVIPVIEQLVQRIHVPISIDTMKPAVARAALEAGASIVNDVAANRADDAMARLVAGTGAAYVCMHMQGTPQTMQQHPAYKDVVSEVGEFFAERLKRLNDCGVAAEHLILDPGIGFGKTAEHNLALLGALGHYSRFQRPLLLGVSRKGFIGQMPGATERTRRVPGSLACACLGAEAGVQIFRVHDVAETVQALRMTEAILAARAQHSAGG